MWLGTTIIASTAVGAGMFSLPIIAAGMWSGYAFLLLVLTSFCMLHSALMILEANLNFAPGSSFSTFVGALLGPVWNTINGLTLAFVLYILCYAYISGGGSIVQAMLARTDVSLPGALASLLFALVAAAIVFLGGRMVGRLTLVLIVAMLLSFALSLTGLAGNISSALLFDMQWHYAPFMLAAIPYFLTAFGFHGNVPSLVKLYQGDVKTIKRCLLLGSVITLCIYTLWLAVNFGNLPRGRFAEISAAGGNIAVLLGALQSVSETDTLKRLLDLFANFAVISSFLGVSLGLFDYIADLLGFDDTARGRLATVFISLGPPCLGALLFPDGFLYAIGAAGLCAAVWGTLVPALSALASRRQYGSPRYRVWGGKGLVYFILAYAVVLILCFVLAALKILPVL
jgi:tryptophan-specific transport protein